MEIAKLHLVSSLEWKSINEDCLICNNPIGSNCIKCDQKPNIISCLSIMNNNENCKHSFHIDCLTEYHRTNQLKCPVFSNKWVSNK